MTTTSGKFFGAGARRGRWYKLDSNGYPDAQSHSTPYEGIEILGITGLDTTIPDARRIPIPGDDRVQATITLPRTEPSSATVRMSGQYYDLVAALSNTKKFTDGEAVGIAYGTDKQGSEADGVLLVNQFGKDAVSKLTRWRCQLFLLVNAVINPPSMADGQANQISMQVTPSATAYMPWREALTELKHGCTEAECVEYMLETEGHLSTWEGNNSATEFNFHADRQASATGKIHAVYTIGTDGTATDVSGTVTKATDGITFGVAPATGVKIVCLYELAG